MALYKKGQSGNPNGRPRGSQDRRVQYRQMLEPHVPTVLNKLVELANGGDLTAIKIFMDRVVPKINTELVNLSPIDKSKSAMQQLTALSEEIDEKVRSGEFSVETGTALYTMLDNRRKLLDTTELEQRIKSLEGIATDKTPKDGSDQKGKD